MIESNYLRSCSSRGVAKVYSIEHGTGERAADPAGERFSAREYSLASHPLSRTTPPCGPAAARRCALAVSVGDPSYRTVKGILAAGTEHQPVARAAGDGGAAAHLHGPEQLFADPVTTPGTNVVPLTAAVSAATTSTTSTARRSAHPFQRGVDDRRGDRATTAGRGRR